MSREFAAYRGPSLGQLGVRLAEQAQDFLRHLLNRPVPNIHRLPALRPEKILTETMLLFHFGDVTINP